MFTGRIIPIVESTTKTLASHSKCRLELEYIGPWHARLFMTLIKGLNRRLREDFISPTKYKQNRLVVSLGNLGLHLTAIELQIKKRIFF
jgi:hypothetical protein